MKVLECNNCGERVELVPVVEDGLLLLSGMSCGCSTWVPPDKTHRDVMEGSPPQWEEVVPSEAGKRGNQP